MNLCEPVLDRYAIFDSYACRPGKGSQKAVIRAQEFARRNRWYLQLDIHKYFDSITHAIILENLQRRFKDPELLQLFKKMLNTYEVAPGCGLPIGNLVSQHLANFYLGAMDHWIKEERRIHSYLRYMDDFIVFGGSRDVLKQELKTIQGWLATTLQLRLREPTKLNRTRLGFTFLGYRIFPGRILLAPESRARFARKLKANQYQYLSGAWSAEELVRHVEPLVQFTRLAMAVGFRNKVLHSSRIIEI